MRHKQYSISYDSLRLVFVIHQNGFDSGSLFLIPCTGHEQGAFFTLTDEIRQKWNFEEPRLFVPTIDWWLTAGNVFKVRTTNFSINFLRAFWRDLCQRGWTIDPHGEPALLDSAKITKALKI